MLETLQFIYLVTRLADVGLKNRERVRRMQERRFRDILQHARQSSAFYRRRLAGLDLERCPPTAIPVTTKADLMANWNEVVTDQRLKLESVQKWIEDESNLGKLYRDRYVICHTSGSQGQPVVVAQTPRDMMLTFGLQVARAHAMQKTMGTFMSRLGDRKRWATISPRPGFYPSGVAWAYMPAAAKRFTNMWRMPLTDPLEKTVAQLNEFKPNFLTGYASVLEMFAREEKAGRLRLRAAGCLQLITNMSEPLNPDARTFIEEAFGVHVSDHYAMGECMGLTVGCPHSSGAHLNADLAYLEVVDEQNRPVPPGVRGAKILVTNLYNRVMPFIRYEVGDVVTMSPRPCPCGSNLPHVLAIEGRTKERFFIRTDGGYRELEWYHFQRPLLNCLDVQEFQVIQQTRERFLVRLAPVQGQTLDLERIGSLLNQQFLLEKLPRTFDFEFEVVPKIGPDPKSNKMRRTIALVEPPAGAGSQK